MSNSKVVKDKDILTMSLKRITVFHKSQPSQGRAVALRETESLEDLIKKIGEKFTLEAKGVYTAQGGLIDDVELIRDDDTLFVSTSDGFTPPSPKHKPSGGDSNTAAVSQPSTTRHQLRAIKTRTSNEWVTLNVGGKYFTTTLGTLQREAPSMLARMFGEQDVGTTWSSCVDSNGAYLMDRSPVYFEPILNYLRHDELILDSNISARGVLEEARYFGIQSLVELLEAQISEEEPPTDHSPVTRREFVLRLLASPSTAELRCQGINFSGANLSRLDLRYINFKFAVMRGTDLSGASLQYCNFERADMSGAKLDGATLLDHHAAAVISQPGQQSAEVSLFLSPETNIIWTSSDSGLLVLRTCWMFFSKF